MPHRVTKLGTAGPVPGVDRVERFERDDAGVFDHAHQIEASVGDGPRAIGKADQRQHRARSPDLGVIGAGGFKRGQRKNAVADRTGPDQQSPHYFKPYRRRALSRRTMRASSTALSRVISLSRSMPVSARPNASRPVDA